MSGACPVAAGSEAMSDDGVVVAAESDVGVVVVAVGS